MNIIGQYLIIIISSLFLIGCIDEPKNQGSNSMKNNERIYLHFGVYGDNDFYEYSKAEPDHHPAGAGFTRIRWKPPQLGKITVGTPYAELDIDNVFNALGTNFQYFKDGIQAIDVTASLHLDEYTTSYNAYRAYVGLVTQLKEKGWKQYFFPSNARIHPDHNLKYMMEHAGEVVDASYILTFEEWQSVISKTRRLTISIYNNDLLLDISIRRPYQDTTTNQEQYMISYAFTTQRYQLLNLISDSHLMTKEELKSAYDKNLIEDEQVREKMEKIAVEEGYYIDESYVDQDLWRYIK